METNVVISCGGTALAGCPNDWDDANAIILKMNDGKDKNEPHWKFDCGFKLDYDGGILSISSRFYPPTIIKYAPTWDGTVYIKILDVIVDKKKFDCTTLGELKTEVDAYIKSIVDKVQALFE